MSAPVGYPGPARITNAEDFALLVRELLGAYLSLLTPNAAYEVRAFRLDVTGDNVHVVMSQDAPGDTCSLQLTVTAPGVRES